MDQTQTDAFEDYLISFVLANHNHNNTFSHPDYLGPAKICQIQGKGRGLISTTDISPGQLIIASAALAIAYPPSSTENESKLKTHVQKLKALRESLVELVETNSETAKLVFNLHAGPQLGFIELQDHDFLKNSIRSDWIERIERICALNSFEGKALKNSYLSNSCTETSSYGLWYYSSFLNHDCYNANCHWSIHGNAMIIRSTASIPKGQELLVSYIDPNQPYKKRLGLFLKHNFQCNCELCLVESAEGQEIRRQREIMLLNFDSEVFGTEGNCNNVAIIRRYIEEIRSSRQNVTSDFGHVFLMKPLIHLGLVHYERGNYVDACKSFSNVFELCSHMSQFTLLRISCILTALICCQRQDMVPDDKHLIWKQRLRQCLIVQFGNRSVHDRTSVVNVLSWIRSSFVEEMRDSGLLDLVCDFLVGHKPEL